MSNSKLSALLGFAILALAILGCSDHGGRKPAKIYIPEGYIGWVRIEYGVPDTPELERDWWGPWEYQKFPPSGLLQTSSTLGHGAASADSFYYSEDGITKAIPREMEHGGIISWCVRKQDGTRHDREFITYFIGPETEYEKRKHELEKFRKDDCQYVINSLDELPKVGSVSNSSQLSTNALFQPRISRY
jgi:hypothetical protein